MSIEAMKLALEAIQDLRGYRPDIDKAIDAIRNAIQQAEAQQPATDEPVAWVVMNGLSKYQVCGAKAPADALCSEMQKSHDLSGSLAAFHVQPLYTHPAPSAPDDSKRLNYLQDRGATIDLIAGVADFYPMRFRVGGLHSSANIDVRAAIDTAMLAAKP